MLSIIILIVIFLSIVNKLFMLSAIMLIVIMLRSMLSVIMLRSMLILIILSVIMLRSMLSLIMQSVIILNVIYAGFRYAEFHLCRVSVMLSVVMLNVVGRIIKLKNVKTMLNCILFHLFMNKTTHHEII